MDHAGYLVSFGGTSGHNSREIGSKIQNKETIMSKKVRIDENECIGCGSCVEICPDVFTFNDDTDKAEVIDENLGEEGCVDDAATSCPVECIHVNEE